MLQFELGGTTYEFDDDVLELDEAIAVKKFTGLLVREFLRGVAQVDPEAIKAMVWLARKRAGEAIRFIDVKFDLIQFLDSVRQVRQADEQPTSEGEAEAETAAPLEPTTANGSGTGTTPKDAGPDTSPPSPFTSA